MLANKQTDFFKEYREKGIPASKVPAQVVDPLISKVMAAPEQMLVKISDYRRFNMNFLQKQFRKSAPGAINALLGNSMLRKKAVDYARK